MLQKTKKLFKPFGTRVFVKFGNANQLVSLDKKDCDQELKEILKTQLEIKGFSDVNELLITHGLSCSSCTKIIPDSVTHPYIIEAIRPKSPGRPRRTG